MSDVGSSNSSPSPSPNDRSSLTTTTSSTTLATSPTTKNTPRVAMEATVHGNSEVTTSTTDATRSDPIQDRESQQSPSAERYNNPPLTSKPFRKRAHSIDVEEANQPRIQDLRLYTPGTATSTLSEGPRELICLCTKAPKVPRPRNGTYLTDFASCFLFISRSSVDQFSPSPASFLLRTH
ncbi:hypothetical protein M426DRAFT_320419 [Hypoxylon sp. CI-4A]|nr:hypothetical protein M426DRAFT_320419 [Hypoxylon sp. CI-4A]